MVFLEIFLRQNLIQIYTKMHHFKKFSRWGMPPNPPTTAHVCHAQHVAISKHVKKILPPPPAKILATPLMSHWRVLCLLAYDNCRCSIQPKISLIKILPGPGFELRSKAGESSVLTANRIAVNNYNHTNMLTLI